MAFKEYLAFGCCCVLYVYEHINRSLSPPLFPIEASVFGLSPLITGIITAMYNITSIMTLLLMPRITSIEKQKTYLIMGGLILGVFLCIFGLTDYSPNAVVFILTSLSSRMIIGVGGALVVACVYPIASSIFPEKHTLITSALQGCIGLGFILGPAIGGLLYAIGGYMVAFTIPGFIGIVLTIISFLILFVPTLHLSDDTKSISHYAITKFANNFHIIASSLAALILSSQMGLRDSAFSAYLFNIYNFNSATTAFLFTARSIMFFLGTLVNSIPVSRGYSPHMLCFSIILYFSSSLTYFYPEVAPEIGSKGYFLFVLVLHGIADSFVYAPTFCVLEWVCRHYKICSSSKILISSWYAILVMVGNVYGSIIFGGIFVDFIGFTRTNLLTAILDLIVFIGVTFYMLKHKYFSNYMQDLLNDDGEEIPIFESRFQY